MINEFRPRGEDLRLSDKALVDTNEITGDLDQWTVPATYDYYLDGLGVVNDVAITGIGATDSFIMIADEDLLVRALGNIQLDNQASLSKQFTLNSIEYNWTRINFPTISRYTAAKVLGWGGLDDDDPDIPLDAFTATGAGTPAFACGFTGWKAKIAQRKDVERLERLVRKRGTPYSNVINLAAADYSTVLANLVPAADLATDNIVLTEMSFTLATAGDPLDDAACDIRIDKSGETWHTIDNFLEACAMANDIELGVPASTTAVWKFPFPVTLEDATDLIQVDEISASTVFVGVKGFKVQRDQWRF